VCHLTFSFTLSGYFLTPPEKTEKKKQFCFIQSGIAQTVGDIQIRSPAVNPQIRQLRIRRSNITIWP